MRVVTFKGALLFSVYGMHGEYACTVELGFPSATESDCPDLLLPIR